MAERRSCRGEAHEVPVEPHPVEPEWVGDQHKCRTSGGISHPGLGRVHRLGRVLALRREPFAVKTADRKRLSVERVADRLQLRIERLRDWVMRSETALVEG